MVWMIAAPGNLDVLVRRIEELEQENLALREFAWAASHDLKEPLRGILLQLELLERSLQGKLDSKSQEAMKHALNSAHLMSSVMPAVEQYIRIQTEQVEYSQVDCATVAGNVVVLLRAALADTGGSVTWSELPCVRSNEQLLTHVFLNLVDNAVRYRSQEPPRIKIGCELRSNHWAFSVTDNGRGIDGKHLEYIFEPFGRLNSRRTSGSGIGLALCRAAVQRLGGKIWAESTKSGFGSVFRFTLPNET